MNKYKDRKYTVIQYDPAWPARFELYANKIKEIFGGSVQVEHIGSTAVSGMAGKPCIDVLVIVDSLETVGEHLKEMERAGFEDAGQFVMQNSRLFRVMKDATLLANIHFFPTGHPHNKEMIDVRDYLRAHPEEARAYSSMKNDLYLKYANDYATYRKYKDEYMGALAKRVYSNFVNTNIGYWEQVLHAPTPAYQELFDAERAYLLKNIKPEMKVLDVGCGDGRNMRTILEKTKMITGVDNDQTAVKDAQTNFSDMPSVKVVYGEAASLPFDDGSFDAVTFLMILPNLDTQKTKALSEAARVVKLDGVVILSTFAETAFDERMKIYKKVGVPIERIEGTKFIFDKSLGANVSEQYSKEEIERLAAEAGLKATDWQKVGTLAYICTLKKI